MTDPREVAPAIEVTALTARYGERVALAGIDVTVMPGERLALLGPNGAGKSTLLAILATLQLPASGLARVCGFDVVSEALEVRRRLGVVFQGASLDGKLTVKENLLLLGNLYGLTRSLLRRRVDEALDRVDLTARGSERVARLSGGLARRVEIARALLHHPAVLLLDEPTAGLDPAARGDIWRFLVRLTDEGTALIVATHLGDEADRCHRVAILDEGVVVTEGEPAQLKSAVGGDVVVVTGDDPERLAAEISERHDCVVKIIDDTIRIERERAHEFIPRLVESFPGRLRSVTLRQPTLEDTFVHFTGRRFRAEESSQ